ncbi:MAG: glycosyltransferase family 4 protein [bacterium]|jgi:glycosyltransferase involved in cell wall biosynthesis|nr:glycosyltransferase family 4 protein [candidate division KSB1 bacterium]MDH7559921.1 glycosyltransferase family 4 protein [bacterium]
MRILYLNYLYDLKGCSLGSAVKPMELFRAMDAMGHRVLMCWMKKQPSMPGGGPLTTKARLKKWLRRYLADVKQLLLNVPYLLRALRHAQRFRPDLIVSRLERGLFCDLVLARLKGLPFVVEGDCPGVYEAAQFQKDYIQYRLLSRFIEWLNVRQADAVIVVSEQLRSYFARSGVSPARLHVVSNGADPQSFSPQVSGARVRQRYALTGESVVGFIGSFSTWHGIENLAELMSRLQARAPAVKFLLVGTGGRWKGWLERYVAEHGLAGSVIFAGYVDYQEMPEYLAAMDVVVAPYPQLPFFYYSPVKIYEYMAAGKPVVSTAIGQIAEVIQDGVTGFLCPPDELDCLVQKIALLVGNPLLRRRMGQAARQAILEQHTWMHKAQAWAKVCAQIAEGARGR